MKTLLILGIAALSVLPARAQLINRQSFGNAAFGGIIGGIIGHNNGRGHTAEGVAIGAASGLLLGAFDRQARRERYYYPAPVTTTTVYAQEPVYSVQPSYQYQAVRPNYSATGVAAGGIVGGIIGHNTGRGHTAEGVAIGAASGLLLGSVAEQNARRYQAGRVFSAAPVPVYSIQNAPTVLNAPVVPAAPQSVTIINNYYGTSPMSGANNLFGR